MDSRLVELLPKSMNLRNGDVKTSVLKSCEVVRNHPLIAKTIPVHGLVMDPKTGYLDLFSDGNAYIEQQNKV